MTKIKLFILLSSFIAFILITIFIVVPQNSSGVIFSHNVEKILSKQEFRHASFGMEFYSLDTHKPIYSYNADKLFKAASTTKLVTCESALQLLGLDYRFRTPIYRTGEIEKDGTLNGDLILVASGDPNLSGRIKGDTLIFANEDHSDGGLLSTNIGDPLFVIRQLAKQISDKGIKRITGRVLIDASLFPQGEGSERTLSPIVVNDNLVDVQISSGKKEDDPASLVISPLTSYVRFINHIKTSKPDSLADIRLTNDIENSDGSRTVTIQGNIPLNLHNYMFAYSVYDPVLYAMTVLTEALREKAIMVNLTLKEKKPDFKLLSSYYTPKRLIAEHVSPPLTEEVKIILKVSQGLHAAILPFLFSKLVAHKEAPQSGFDLMRGLLLKAGLNMSEASQNDGAGEFGYFTPKFMVRYMEYIRTQNTYDAILNALPILGKDGTLYDIQVNSPAAGHVFGKTGTMAENDALNRGLIVTAKSLVGYMTTKKKHHIVFAIYISNVLISDPDKITKVVGQTIGELVTSAYEDL